MGSISLVLGPVIAATVAAANSAPRAVAEVGASGSLVERTGHSVLSVGHVVAVRASDPAAVTVPPLPLIASPPVVIKAPPVLTVPLVVAPTPPPAPKVVASPTPKPVAPPVHEAVANSGSVQDIILAAASSHGVDGGWMVRIARCESGLNPRAINPAGPWIGLFQFAPATFRGHGGTDIYSPTQQANIAAAMLAGGQAHQWPVCSRR